MGGSCRRDLTLEQGYRRDSAGYPPSIVWSWERAHSHVLYLFENAAITPFYRRQREFEMAIDGPIYLDCSKRYCSYGLILALRSVFLVIPLPLRTTPSNLSQLRHDPAALIGIAGPKTPSRLAKARPSAVDAALFVTGRAFRANSE
ncbi:MAG: hypothetical protein Q9169_004052 [Polycauliona sp. 2 TL-2023]